MNTDLKSMLQTLITTSGPLGVLAVLVWLEVQTMSATLTDMAADLAVCVASTTDRG